MVEAQRRSPLAVATIVTSTLGLTAILIGIFHKPHQYWLQDCGGLLVLTSIGAGLRNMRVRVRDTMPVMLRLRRLCDFAGVSFGLGNAAYPLLFPFTCTTLILSVAFLAGAMILKTEHTVLHLVSDAFQFLCTLGIGIFATRGRKVESILRKLESIAQSGKRAVPPPTAAKFILLLIPKRHREHIIGDLEEEYTTIMLPEYGARKAQIWYWWQVAISIVPLLWAQIRWGAAVAWLWKRMR